MTVVGITPSVLRFTRVVRDPVRGTSWEAIYEGTADAINILFTAVAAGIYKEIDPSSAPLYRLILRSGDDGGTSAPTEVTTIYELAGNSKSIDLRFAPAFAALNADNLVDLVNKAEDPKNNTEIPVPTADGYRQFYKMWQLGQKETHVSEYVVKVSKIISNRSQFQIGYANIERVYNAAQLVAEIAPPVNLFFSIEFAMASVLPSFIDPDYQFGWLKQTPQVQNVGLKFQITNEWYLGTWPTIINKAAS